MSAAKTLLLAAGSLLLPAAQASANPACVDTDLTRQWSGVIRDQGQYGSCHTFAAAALIEAKIARQSGTAAPDLSELDLFEQHVVASKTDIQGNIEIIYGRSLLPNQGEGGWVKKSIDRFRNRGVCMEESFPYQPNGASQSPLLRRLDRLRQTQRIAQEETQKTLSDQYSCGGEAQGTLFLTFLDFTGTITNTLDTVVWNDIERAARAEKCAAERRLNRDAARNWRVRTMDDKAIRSENIEQLMARVRRLLENQTPVAVTVIGYEKLRTGTMPSGSEGGHVVVLAGYDCEKHEFIVRNSWGGTFERVPAAMMLRWTYNLDWIE